MMVARGRNDPWDRANAFGVPEIIKQGGAGNEKSAA